jgi:hypothetical protein
MSLIFLGPCIQSYLNTSTEYCVLETSVFNIGFLYAVYNQDITFH